MMNRACLSFVIFLVTSFSLRSTNNLSQFEHQEIRYVAEGATEVFFIWGTNGWQIPQKELWPAGTFQKGNLLHTPMVKEDGYFSISFLVPQKTMVDYVFWISKSFKGKDVDIWDINKLPNKDYHTLATDKNIALIKSTFKVSPKEALTIFDFAIPAISGAFVLLVLFLVIARWKKYSYPPVGSVKIILTSSLILFLGFLFIRPSIAGNSWELYNHPFDNIAFLLIPSFYDIIFVLLITFIFLIPALSLSKYPRIQKSLIYSYPVLCLLFLIIGLMNIRIVEMLGKPFTYQWLYYSDFLNSADSKSAISANINNTYLTNILIICLSAIILWYLLLKFSEIIKLNKLKKIVAYIILFAISGSYLLYAGSSQNEKKWDYNKLSNPVSAFLESANPFVSNPELFTMEVPDSLRYSQVSRNPSLQPVLQKPGKIKNVILFVLESTPAEYISGYGSKYQVTPELEKYFSNSLVFENIYAHAPATNNSMVSLLGSVFPQLSCATLTQEHPDIILPTLSSELKKKGYRTAFFNSADNRFQQAGEFLSFRKFDAIQDCRDNNCDQQQFKVKDEKWNFLDGKDDQCTQEAMMSWITESSDAPFFAMMWTYQTHYPYFATGKEIMYEPTDPFLNRYLNAVHHSDEVFGGLIKSLISKGLFESTLIVLVGDHGEAFGRHNQITHASNIYEENLHVPCVFINPLFAQKKYSGIGGLIDIAPTVMSLLNITTPQEWQGKNLFSATKNDRVYFFAPWSDYLFGYREGDQKYIFNATRNLTEIYNLRTDPQEQKNLALDLSKKNPVCHQRLASWVQYVNASTKKLLKSN